MVIDRVGDGIRADLSSADDTARALQEALAGGPITRLVNNVLDFGRLEAGRKEYKPETVALGPWLARLVGQAGFLPVFRVDRSSPENEKYCLPAACCSCKNPSFPDPDHP